MSYEDDRFDTLRAAYLRGYQWAKENPDSTEFAAKAAYDYADKETSQQSKLMTRIRSLVDGIATGPDPDASLSKLDEILADEGY